MAFFDDLSRKISQAGQTTIQKTKDIAEISRLNSMIAELEKTIESNYSQIGKLYVALHPDDYADDFSGMIGTVADAEARIREMRDHVMSLKGMVRCQNCGGEVSAMSIYCDNCGAEMPRKKELENMVVCEGCGQMVTRDNRFCPLCGKPMATVRIAENPDDAPRPSNCANCGAEMTPGSAFCTQCGNRI